MSDPQEQNQSSCPPPGPSDPSPSCLSAPPRNDVADQGDAVMDLILEFQSVTGMEDMDESRRILDAHNWDLLQAISHHMGFERLEPQAQIFPPAPTPVRPSQVQDETNRATQGPPMDMVPRPAAAPPARGILGLLWKILTAPVHLVFEYLWDFLAVGLRFIGADSRRAITDPVQDVMNFITQFESTYGTNHPVFYQGTYGQALSDAKRELKFLLVYLHSGDHGDSGRFCRDVLSHEPFQDLVHGNMLFWGCDVRSPEGYRTSQALRENTYPFLALIVLKNNRMTIVARIEGLTDPTLVTQSLTSAVRDHEVFLIAERADRLERSATQTLRQEQDAAYQESLRRDQEKERRKKEEAQKLQEEQLEKERLIQEEQNRREELKQLKETTRFNLKAEPQSNHPDSLRVLIKLPNGTRLERRFLKGDSLKDLYAFVFSHPEAPDSFEIATNFPKRTLPLPKGPPPKDFNDPDSASATPTFIEFGLGRNEMLFVYDLES